MATNALTNDKLRELYARHLSDGSTSAWTATIQQDLCRFQALSPDEIDDHEAQAALWATTGIASLGQGEYINVNALCADPAMRAGLRGVRETPPELSPAERAERLQSAYDALLGRAMDPTLGLRVRPRAKLLRAFIALLPRHLDTLFREPNRGIANALLDVSGAEGPVASAVLRRARLRSALGPEADVDEDARRIAFSWWLTDGGAEGLVDPNMGRQTMIVQRIPQLKGLVWSQGHLDMYRLILREALNGLQLADIGPLLLGEVGDGKKTSTHLVVLNQMRAIGLLERRDGQHYPTEAGRALLDDDIPDALVELVLTRTLGLGHLLRHLKLNGAMARDPLVRAVQRANVGWKTRISPSQIVVAAAELGLRTPGGGPTRLTEYGKAWEARLPATLWEVKDPVDGGEDRELLPSPGPTPPPPFGPTPTAASIVEAIAADSATSTLVLSAVQIQTLHVAFHCNAKKRFVILSGLSGSGKTRLLTAYAETYLRLAGLSGHESEHLVVVPVSPDWRDPAGLLGYLNPLGDKGYQMEPTLRLLLRAVDNPGSPYFLILDEMNLARVEQYFAPFLSAMETGGHILLHGDGDLEDGPPESVAWPSNLFIGGTVNMDETTHAFSDKVLDRAFTFEFWDVDLKTFFSKRPATDPSAHFSDVETLLLGLNEWLLPVRRHFGYRAAGEVLAFVEEAGRCGVLTDGTRAAFIDAAIFAKVLPRIRGEHTKAFEDALRGISDLCRKSSLVRCQLKTEEMLSRLITTGVTRFAA